MTFARLICIILEVTGMYITASPPNPPPSKRDCIVPNWREVFLRKLAWPCIYMRTIFWLTALVEAVVIITNMGFLYKIERPFTTHISMSADNIAITPLSLLGSLITFSGSMLRLSCYRTLGKLFTFELSLQHDHRLITDGPYKYIRHPSYTGMILTILGVICSHSSKGTWLQESGILQFPLARLLAIYWLVVAMAVIASLVLRLANEDEMLRHAFGEEWTAWSEKVTYRLVPGVY